MTDYIEVDEAKLPPVFPFLLNTVLAAGIGGIWAGWLGALFGALVLLGIFALLSVLGYVQRRRAGLLRIADASGTLLKPVFGLLLLPVVMAISAVIMVPVQILAWISKQVGTPEAIKNPGQKIANFFRRATRFFLSFGRPDVLPLTVANFLLLLIIGSVVIGIDVAFYAALVAVPIMIVGMVMVAINSSREPTDEQD